MGKRLTREEKYPNTDTFFYYNANPKGRITGDCRIRAISVACEVPYNQVVRDLCEIQCETGYDQCENQGISLLMKRYGWEKHNQPRKADRTKYTGAEFCKWLDEYWNGGNVFCHLGGRHDVCIKRVKHWDGKLHYKVVDIWNSTGGCVGNWWTKD